MLRTCVLILLSCSLAPSEEKTPAPADLTPAARQRLDRATLRLPEDAPHPEPRELAGGLGGWIVSRVALAPEEEKELAAAVDKKLLEAQKVNPTPATAQKLFDRLVKELPEPLRPDCFRYRLTVLEHKEPLIFTTGAGHVYITTALLDPVLADKDRGPAMLSFFLAAELGHVARLHTRRGYQLEKLLEETERDIGLKVDSDRLREALQTTPAPPDRLAPFLYTRRQQNEADLFALHLCRNAGLGPDATLDAVRWLAAVRQPRLLSDDEARPEEREPSAVWKEYVGTHQDGLRRLRRLREEWLGLADPELYGLFRYDASSEKFTRLKDGALKGDERPIVFIHGLHGGRHSFAEMIAFFAARRELKGRPLLAFFYPGDGSLSLGGRLLSTEVKRTLGDSSKTDFVCHSAGGLVFRFYTEKEGGAFGQAVLLATPHQGSNLTRLKFLADLRGFVRGLRNGLPETLSEMLSDGQGEIKHDLQPESLFLRYLGYDARLAGRYHVFYGRAMGSTRARLLELAIEVARSLLRDHLDVHESGLLKRLVSRLVEQLTLPEEISDGDLIVSVKSASLKGAASVTGTRENHQGIKKDEAVMLQVLERIR